MGMTIDLAIKVLKRMIKKGRFSYREGYAFESIPQNEEKACSFAIDTMNRYQQLQADYENRLRADMVAMLEVIKLRIDNLPEPLNRDRVNYCIQQKINELKADQEGEK